MRGFLPEDDHAQDVVIGHVLDVHRSDKLAGKERSFLELRKGGACLLEFTGRLAPANATLLWHLTAAQLRSLR